MARAYKTNFRDVTCGECSRVFITNEPRKLFCDPCSRKRTDEAQGRGVMASRLAKNPGLKLIRQQSALSATSLVDAFGRPLDYSWSVTFSTPYSLNASKNRRLSNSGVGIHFLRKEVREYQNDLIHEVRIAMADVQVKQAKVWISLFVQKENHRSDAINVVDTICDAIKNAIGIDDRWYCLDRVDWEIKKEDPRIYIRIAQEVDEDMIACSHCGSVLPATDFTKRRGGPFGRSRVCSPCVRVLQGETKRVRREMLA